MSPLGVPELQGRCCPDARKLDGALSAASPTSPPMSPRSSPRPSGSQAAARPGCQWGARSTQRPPWGGAHARAGGAGTSRGKSTRCTSCRSPSAKSSTGCGRAFAASPRASLRRGARAPSGGLATGQMARPAAQRYAPPPPSWRIRCCAALWPRPCGRQQGCRAMARGPTPRAPTAAPRTSMRSTSCGTARSESRLGRHGVPGSVTRRRPSPNWGRPTSGRPACGRGASSPSGWRRGWIGGSWTSSCTACTACTWRSSRPAWLRAAGTRRATGTPFSRTSRGRGPLTPTCGTISSAPFQGTRSATSHGSDRGPRRAGDGPRTSSRTWSGGPGHWPGCRGRRKSPGLSWPWSMRRLWGGRSRPPRITARGLRACRLGSEPKSYARRQASLSATLWRVRCCAGRHWGVAARSSLWGAACVQDCQPARFSRHATSHEVMLQLMRLATHFQDLWVRRLRAPARMRPPPGDRFLMDYFPRPLEGGGGGLLPYAWRPHGRHPRAPPKSVQLAASHRSRHHGRAVALRVRYAWNMGRRRAPGAEA